MHYRDGQSAHAAAWQAPGSKKSDMTPQETFRGWYLPWKERVCTEARCSPHGTVFRSPRHPDFWEYNCVRLERVMTADEMIATADRELAGCAHRLVEWLVPMPEGVISDLRQHGWIASPLIYLRHDGRPVPQNQRDLVEVDYDAVRELRDLWHREDFGEHTETDSFHAQAREVAEWADVRVIAARQAGRPIAFAQVETHDDGSEVTQVFVHPEHRGSGWGGALTASAIHIGAESAADIWICAARDGRARRLYERLGFHLVVEMAHALLPPRPT